jgi:arylsulfatase B
MKAMTEAMDTEIGRLLASMDPATLANTYVIFVGDNGTNGEAITPPWDPAKGKGTVFEGGINVPLIITGPTVLPGAESPALLHVVDLFATIAELAGADASSADDSTSFALHLSVPTAHTPQIVYGERFRPNGFGPYTIYQQVARKGNYKYMRFYNPTGALVNEDLYNLQADPFETEDLLLGPLDPVEMMVFLDLSAYMDALD